MQKHLSGFSINNARKGKRIRGWEEKDLTSKIKSIF
jgi:hypothetical protein